MYNTEDIPIGRENAISRKQLKTLWNLNDRSMRDEIANKRLVDDGSDYVIVSSSGVGGYFRSDEEFEIRRMIAENVARIQSLQLVNNVARQKIERKRRRDGGDRVYETLEILCPQNNVRRDCV